MTSLFLCQFGEQTVFTLFEQNSKLPPMSASSQRAVRFYSIKTRLLGKHPNTLLYSLQIYECIQALIFNSADEIRHIIIIRGSISFYR